VLLFGNCARDSFKEITDERWINMSQIKNNMPAVKFFSRNKFKEFTNKVCDQVECKLMIRTRGGIAE